MAAPAPTDPAWRIRRRVKRSRFTLLMTWLLDSPAPIRRSGPASSRHQCEMCPWWDRTPYRLTTSRQPNNNRINCQYLAITHSYFRGLDGQVVWPAPLAASERKGIHQLFCSSELNGSDSAFMGRFLRG